MEGLSPMIEEYDESIILHHSLEADYNANGKLSPLKAGKKTQGRGKKPRGAEANGQHTAIVRIATR